MNKNFILIFKQIGIICTFNLCPLGLRGLNTAQHLGIFKNSNIHEVVELLHYGGICWHFEITDD